jgi:hypothetical protein
MGANIKNPIKYAGQRLGPQGYSEGLKQVLLLYPIANNQYCQKTKSSGDQEAEDRTIGPAVARN